MHEHMWGAQGNIDWSYNRQGRNTCDWKRYFSNNRETSGNSSKNTRSLNQVELLLLAILCDNSTLIEKENALTIITELAVEQYNTEQLTKKKSKIGKCSPF